MKSNQKSKYYRILWHCTTLEGTYSLAHQELLDYKVQLGTVSQFKVQERTQVRSLGQRVAKSTETENQNLIHGSCSLWQSAISSFQATFPLKLVYNDRALEYL